MDGLTVSNIGLQQFPVRHEHRAAVGVDLGKMTDHTAIAVVERETYGTGAWELRAFNKEHEVGRTDFRVRAVRRLPLVCL